MTRIVLDPASEAKLRGLTEQVEVCGESGDSLGVFIPAATDSLYASVVVPFTEEELEQAEAETESYTTAEVLAHLEKLKCTPSAGSE